MADRQTAGLRPATESRQRQERCPGRGASRARAAVTHLPAAALRSRGVGFTACNSCFGRWGTKTEAGGGEREQRGDASRPHAREGDARTGSRLPDRGRRERRTPCPCPAQTASLVNRTEAGREAEHS